MLVMLGVDYHMGYIDLQGPFHSKLCIFHVSLDFKFVFIDALKVPRGCLVQCYMIPKIVVGIQLAYNKCLLNLQMKSVVCWQMWNIQL